MADQNIIEVHFGDENLTPEKIRSQDIATIITAIEQMLAVIVANDNPALDIDESKVSVGLSAVGRGSYVMQFQTQYPSEVQRAYAIVTHAIDTRTIENLPIRSIEALKKVRTVCREYRTDALFGYRNGKFQPIATVSSTTPINDVVPEISGSTTLYGILTGIGGDDPPKARLTLINGAKITCNVTEKDNLAVARQLGRRLYSEVGVKGEARWDLRDMSLIFFRIDELLDYDPIPLTEALNNLYNVAGQHFEAIDDIEALIADLRGSDEV